ncbi:heat-shock protein, partial [Trifolium medium]|nr:heat-shock protein [Trifolium medium]
MVVFNEGKRTMLDVCSLNICANNAIEVCEPSFVSNDFGFVFKGIFEGRVNWYQQGIKKSSPCFWFRKKFPPIILCCAGEPPMNKDNM